MSTTAITLPAEFNHAALVNQLHAWKTEGHTQDDILAQAQHTWPTLPDGYLLASLHSLQRHMQPRAIDPHADLHRIHRRRARHISKVEKALDAENVTASMHNLYRGLLRDHEAACYKLIDLNMQDAATVSKQVDKTRASEIKEEIAQGKQLREEHRQWQRQFTEQTSSKNGAMKTLSCLIGLVLSMFLTGCSSSARTVSTNLYTVTIPANTLAVTDTGSHDGCRQRTPQLLATSAENYQTLLQRTTHDPARSPGATRG